MRIWGEKMADVDEAELHPKSIKLPPAVEVFANLKNAQNFAIDIGEWSYYFYPIKL